MVFLTYLDCDGRMRGSRFIWTFLFLVVVLITIIYYAESIQYLGFVLLGNQQIEEDAPPLSSSTCSAKASKRGPHQHVASFSLYGIKSYSETYVQGIQQNYKLLDEMHPTWLMRVYHDVPPSNKKLYEKLLDYERRFSNLHLCSIYSIPGYGDLQGMQERMWRFLPMLDPLVDVFISRNLDNRLSDRELDAVTQWLNTNLTFHVMRDHPEHKDPILGGMWGMQVAKARETAMVLMSRMMIRSLKSKNKYFDQSFLRNIVWPYMKGDVLQHDSYHCKEYSSHGHMTAWPKERLSYAYNFVGAIVPSGLVKLSSVCPIECRPPNHKHWTMC